MTYVRCGDHVWWVSMQYFAGGMSLDRWFYHSTGRTPLSMWASPEESVIVDPLEVWERDRRKPA